MDKPPPGQNGNAPGRVKPEHELEHFGPLSNYVPGGDYEALKEAAGPQVTLDFHGPIGSNNEDEGYDTYFNSNELPPTPSDFGPTANTGPNNADNFLQNQSLPPRSSGGLFDTSGPPRHSGVKDPFNDPFGDGSFPKGPNNFGDPGPTETDEAFGPSGPPETLSFWTSRTTKIV